MASSKRDRELARERYLRQQARREADRRKQKQRTQVIAAFVTVLVVLGGAVGIGALVTHDNGGVDAGAKTTATTGPSASPAVVGCNFTATGKPSRPVTLPTLAADATVANYDATLTTSAGAIVIAVDGADAPCAATSFAHLAKAKFYDGTICHRETAAAKATATPAASPSTPPELGLSVLQCGDPTGTGTGGPGYTLKEEHLPVLGPDGNTAVYAAGTVAMAKTAAPSSTGSQFFLVYADSALPPQYTVLGTITKGLDVLKAVAAKGIAGGGLDGAPANKVTITSVTTTDKATS